jgi:hypothetical protein
LFHSVAKVSAEIPNLAGVFGKLKCFRRLALSRCTYSQLKRVTKLARL